MILAAAWVVPISGPPIRDGFVQVHGPRIAAVGRRAELPPAAAARARDLGSVALLPGLVNPHTHLELTGYAGKLAPGPFWSWVAGLVKLRRMPGRIEREQAGVQAGAWQSLRAGVTCVGDISRENIAWPVLREIPIRKVCFAELLTLADQPPRNLDELRAAVAAIREDELLTAGVSAHAPYSVPREALAGAIELARALRRPWCTHWAETREEVAFLRGAADALPAFLRGLLAQCGVCSPGLGAIEYLARCAGRDWPGALAHANYVDPAEHEALARAGHVVIYCPRAHRFFGHGPHPLRRLRAAGVPVAIGTDSAASNESLAPLAELRYLRTMVPDAPAPAELLRMVTLDAARALRLEDRIGTLAPGREADLAAFPVNDQAPDPVADVIDHAPAAAGVWVAGRRVV